MDSNILDQFQRVILKGLLWEPITQTIKGGYTRDPRYSNPNVGLEFISESGGDAEVDGGRWVPGNWVGGGWAGFGQGLAGYCLDYNGIWLWEV